MSGSEFRRVHVIRQVVEQQLTQQQASEALGVTTQQIRRLRHRLQAEGESGLAHRSRGQPWNSWRRIMASHP
ncbi:MAG: helix-turn-helix domain-containing protein [Nitrospira sp.]|nr:helix-turn-helix domain-containing protein [Nitrospira sp.]